MLQHFGSSVRFLSLVPTFFLMNSFWVTAAWAMPLPVEMDPNGVFVQRPNDENATGPNPGFSLFLDEGVSDVGGVSLDFEFSNFQTQTEPIGRLTFDVPVLSVLQSRDLAGIDSSDPNRIWFTIFNTETYFTVNFESIPTTALYSLGSHESMVSFRVVPEPAPVLGVVVGLIALGWVRRASSRSR